LPLTVYKSSAGSGKTYTLVKEYIKLCIKTQQEYAFRNILAITFTNKATSEMKERVVKTLKALCNNKIDQKYQPLIEDLVVELKIPAHEISFRCQKVITSLLHNYSDFTITTIDKFTYKIIKAFSFDLQLPLHFEVSLEEEGIIELAVDELIANTSTNPWLKNLLGQYIKYNLVNEHGWNIEKTLQTFAKKLISEESYFFLDNKNDTPLESFEKVQKDIDLQKNNFTHAILQNCRLYKEVLEKSGIDFAWFKHNTLPKYIEKLEEFARNPFGTPFEKLLPNKTLVSCVENSVFYGQKIDRSAKEKMDQYSDEFCQIFNAIQMHIESQKNTFVLCKLVQQNLFPIVLLHEIKKHQEAMAKNMHQVHISEFNKKIAAILKDEPVAYIYERMGERYRHFLMDEFQDTSKLQWNNIVPLLEESIATGNDNYIVGDAKQAIYRWRGGAVDQFVQLPEQPFHQNIHSLTESNQEALKALFPVKILGFNYRSKNEIVFFNNMIFEGIKVFLAEGKQKMYEQHHQEVTSNHPGGYIEFIVIEKKKKKDLDEGEEDTAFAKEAFILTLEKINTSVKKGYSYRDICILSRNNRELKEYATFLMEQNIPIVSSESLLLESSLHVQLIIAFIDWFNMQTIQKTTQLLYTLKKTSLVSDEQFMLFYKDIPAFKKHIAYTFGFEHIRYQAFNVYEKIEYCIELFGINKVEDAFVHGLLDLSFGFINKRENSENAFLDYWNKNKHRKSLSLSENKDAVQLMTIHKSKGLEFPIVILTNVNWPIEHSSKNENFWVHPKEAFLKDLSFILLPDQNELLYTSYAYLHEQERENALLDSINMLYVALTRAAECLYVFSVYETKKEAKLNSIHEYMCNVLKQTYAHFSLEIPLTIGTLENKKSSTIKPIIFSDSSITYQYSNPWQQKIEVSFEYEKYLFEHKTRAGKITHELLSKIYSAEDIKPQLNFWEKEGLISSAEIRIYEELIQKIIHHPSLQAFYKRNVLSFNERDILLESGEILRPDKLVVSKEKIVIIDYKTGAKNNKHIQQIKNYQLALQKIYAQPMVGYLIYLSEPELEMIEVRDN
jgi:ATP-dependent exoDNAse (exonuclease V) beta subunit